MLDGIEGCATTQSKSAYSSWPKGTADKCRARGNKKLVNFDCGEELNIILSHIASGTKLTYWCGACLIIHLIHNPSTVRTKIVSRDLRVTEK